MKKLGLLLSCLGFFYVGLSMAAEDNLQTVPTGPYIEGTLGLSHVTNRLSDQARNNQVSVSHENGLGYSLNLGYQTNHLLAWEAGISSYSAQRFSSAPIAGSGQTKTITVSSDPSYLIDLAAKWTFPINDKFDVFGKVGPAFMTRNGSYDVDEGSGKASRFNEHDHGWGALYGVGVDYNFTPHAALTAQATGATPVGEISSKWGNPDVPSMFLLSGGFKFTF